MVDSTTIQVTACSSNRDSDPDAAQPRLRFAQFNSEPDSNSADLATAVPLFEAWLLNTSTSMEPDDDFPQHCIAVISIAEERLPLEGLPSGVRGPVWLALYTGNAQLMFQARPQAGPAGKSTKLDSQNFAGLLMESEGWDFLAMEGIIEGFAHDDHSPLAPGVVLSATGHPDPDVDSAADLRYNRFRPESENRGSTTAAGHPPLPSSLFPALAPTSTDTASESMWSSFFPAETRQLFFSHFFGREVSLQRGDAAKAALLEPAQKLMPALFDLLSIPQQGPSTIRVVHYDSDTDESHSRYIDTSTADSAAQGKKTITADDSLVYYLEHFVNVKSLPVWGQFHQQLSSLLVGLDPTIHIYDTPPQAQALPLHTDPYDVVVVQLGGNKP